MNERTRELWVQCVRKHTKDPMNWQDVADEFAELIIKECAGLVQGVPIDTMGYQSADQKIRQHFGVEE